MIEYEYTKTKGEINMPTGYTNKIYVGEEVSMKEFMMECAKAFGANIALRDQDPQKGIPVYHPQTKLYEDRIALSKQGIEELESNVNRKQIEQMLNERYDRALQDAVEEKARKTELEKRYNTMIAQVKSWEPPTEEHVNLKQFAIEQLEASRNSDCIIWRDNIEKVSVDEYIESMHNHYTKDIEYYTRKIEEEIQRTEERNKWNQDLFDSLT